MVANNEGNVTGILIYALVGMLVLVGLTRNPGIWETILKCGQTERTLRGIGCLTIFLTGCWLMGRPDSARIPGFLMLSVLLVFIGALFYRRATRQLQSSGGAE